MCSTEYSSTIQRKRKIPPDHTFSFPIAAFSRKHVRNNTKMNATQAEELLRTMEEKLHNRLHPVGVTTTTAQEPEWEIHADESERTERLQELQDRLNEICSLKDLFAQQSVTISLLHQHNKIISYEAPLPLQSISNQPMAVSDYDDFSSNSLVCAGGSANAAPEEAPNNTLYDTLNESSSSCSFLNFDLFLQQPGEGDDDSFQLDFEGTDSEIQNAINEIRKEASRMDVVMALDQLHTIQNELSVVTKAMQERSVEAEDLRIQLEEKDERIACLKLERDLFQADACKLREDLQTCVDSMFNISLAAGSSSVEPTITNRQNGTRQVGSQAMQVGSPTVSQDVFRKLVSPPSAARPLAPPQDVFRKHLQTSIAELESTCAQQWPVVNFPSIDVCCPAIEMISPQTGFLPEQTRAVIRRRVFASDSDIPKHPGNLADRTNIHETTRSIVSQPSQKPQKPRSKSFSVEREVAEPRRKESSRICGMLLRKLRPSQKDGDIAVMRQQIDSLHDMMKTSMTTSEKLRKRLAMISGYYESIIQKLQQKNAHIKTEKSRMEVDLVNQISTMDHEKRAVVIKLQRKLRELEEELAMLNKSSR
jgi:hypothetical protein